MILCTSRRYKAQHGKVPTIIVDNCNRLLEKAPEPFYFLQDNAKVAADNHELKTVFISSEAHVPLKMRGECPMPPAHSTTDHHFLV
jgi:hypothetical protein